MSHWHFALLDFCLSSSNSFLFFDIQSLMFCMKIWALQNGTALVVGGKTNRAKNQFPDDMNRLLDQVPELIKKNTSVVSEQS